MFRIIVIFVYLFLAPLGFCNSIAELRGKVLELGGVPVMEVRSRWVIIIGGKKTVIHSRDLYMEDGILVTLRKSKEQGKNWYVHYVGPWPDFGPAGNAGQDDGSHTQARNRLAGFGDIIGGDSEVGQPVSGIEGRCLVDAGKRVKTSL